MSGPAHLRGVGPLSSIPAYVRGPAMPIVPTWLSLPVLVLLYRPLVRLWPGMDKDRYVRWVVAAANSYFFPRYASVPYRERMLFLPYCLRHRLCPTTIDREAGLVCPRHCSLECRVAEMRNLAQRLGYLDVQIVVSGRLHAETGVLRSRDFLVRHIRQRQPRAVLGCLCTEDLRRKYLVASNLSPSGTLGGHGLSVVPQVVLLTQRNCWQSSVDWDSLRRLIEASAA
ncbi:MAG: DUF116 domain-containing protein [Chloroflexota bacterium]